MGPASGRAPAARARLNSESQSSTYDPERRRRTTNRLGAFPTHHGVVQHHKRIADAHFRVENLSIGRGRACRFLSAKPLLVPLDGLHRIVESQLRRNGVVPCGTACLAFVIAPPFMGDERVTEVVEVMMIVTLL